MAKENVKKFIEEVSKNKELQEKITAAQNGYEPEGKSEEDILEDILLPIAKETGYEFTVSEYRAAQREAMSEKGISEEELENVSGGDGCCDVIGYGDGLGACLVIGANTDNKSEGGIGILLCAYLGLGVGAW